MSDTGDDSLLRRLVQEEWEWLDLVRSELSDPEGRLERESLAELRALCAQLSPRGRAELLAHDATGYADDPEMRTLLITTAGRRRAP